MPSPSGRRARVRALGRAIRGRARVRALGGTLGRADGLGRAIGRAAGLAFAAASLLGGPVALGASPSPTPGGAGDPRSSGQGPGLVGDPLLAIVVVLAIGALALVATLAYVRMTGGPRRP